MEVNYAVSGPGSSGPQRKDRSQLPNKVAQMWGSRQEGTGGGLVCLLLTGVGIPQTSTMPEQHRVNELLLLHELHHKAADLSGHAQRECVGQVNVKKQFNGKIH